MYKFIFTGVFLFCSVSFNIDIAKASTPLSGSLSADTTLTASSSPYIVESLVVESGVTLTIESGVVIKFQDASGMTVHGSLLAQGTDSEPVYVTSIHDDTVGGDTNSDGTSTVPKERDWRSITFTPGSTAEFDHSVIRYAGYGNSKKKSQPAIYNTGGDVTVVNSVISNNSQYGIGQTSGSLRLEGSMVRDHHYGVVLLGGVGVFDGNTFENSLNKALFAQGAVSIDLNHNNFVNNNYPADIDLGNGLSLTNSGNTASGNYANGLVLRGSISNPITLSPDDIPYVLTSGGGLDASGELVVQANGGLTVASGGTLNIGPGVVKFTDAAELVVDGTLKMSGTEQDKVYFTSLKDDTVGGDANSDGDSTTPQAEDWKHIRLNTGSNVILDHVVVRHGGGSWRYGGSRAGIHNNGGTLTVTNSEITQNYQYGLLQDSGTATIHQSLLHNNPSFGVRNLGSEVIDATNNYWGDPSGPYHNTSNPQGLGNAVSDNVLFDPWWESEDPTPPVDPLILQYAPILYMHENEDYLPMNVEAYVEASALWDGSGIDSQLYNASDLTTSQFNEVIDNNDTSDYYLAFSDPDTAGSVDLGNAKAVYDSLVNSGEATTTIYYHKMEDGFTDSFGKDHNYIVLQYWFFYAMNNWGEHGGYNDHEGDWESVFVFLDKDTEEPKYVAFSSHLNDGFPNASDKQYASVRKKWNGEVETDGDSVISYVALGSHANYSDDNNGSHVVPLVGHDLTSSDKEVIPNSMLDNLDESLWSLFGGYWGTQTGEEGFDGPQGPKYIDVTGQRRYSEPVEWAGLDNIDVVAVEDVTDFLEFAKQGIKMSFDSAIEAGTEVTVDWHEEVINFGQNIEELNLLPNFWDLGTSLNNGNFEVDITFAYDPEVVAALGGDESSVTVMYNNLENDTWEPQESTVNTEEDTVTFTTSHFSRYALGLVEAPTLEELYEELRGVVNESDLRFYEKRLLLSFINQSERIHLRKNSLWQTNSTRLLDLVVKTAERYAKRQRLSQGEVDTINDLVEKIKELIKAEQQDGEEACESSGLWLGHWNRVCDSWRGSSGHGRLFW